jgi:D-psicose/D-tagatose/L-ribulose 3-epimerase
MKFSMNLQLWTQDVLNEDCLPLLERLKAMGFDGVEIPIRDPQPERFAALGRRLDGLGLERTAVTVSRKDANPISPDPANRRRGMEHLFKVLDCCGSGGFQLMVGPFYTAPMEFPGHGPDPDEWRWGVDSLRPVAEHGRALGVGLALEFLNRFETHFLTCAADTDRFVRAIGVPGCGSLYDTFHANIEEKSASQAVAAVAGTLRHVHISENDRSTPGSGSVAWDETFLALRRIEYDGWLTIEAFGTASPALSVARKIWRRMYQDEETLAREGLAFLKGMTAAYFPAPSEARYNLRVTR